MVTHKWSYCDLCECHITLCGTCGNNVCNGGAGEVDGEPCPDCESSYQEWIANPEKVQANKPASTPDIAGLCERLRKLTRSFKQYMGASSVEDMVKAADTLERQAAENKRLRVALERIADPRNIHFAGDAQVVARAALTGKDAATLGLSGKTQTDDRTRGDG